MYSFVACGSSVVPGVRTVRPAPGRSVPSLPAHVLLYVHLNGVAETELLILKMTKVV